MIDLVLFIVGVVLVLIRLYLRRVCNRYHSLTKEQTYSKSAEHLAHSEASPYWSYGMVLDKDGKIKSVRRRTQTWYEMFL
jgi:hypothetical protein